MRSLTFIYTAVLTAAVYVSQVAATPPACLLACVSQASRDFSCSMNQVSCICSNESGRVQKCLEDICPSGDAARALEAFGNTCKEQGQSVDFSRSSASASSTSASSAPPSRTSYPASSHSAASSSAAPSASPSHAPSSASKSTSEEYHSFNNASQESSQRPTASAQTTTAASSSPVSQSAQSAPASPESTSFSSASNSTDTAPTIATASTGAGNTLAAGFAWAGSLAIAGAMLL